MKQVVLSMLLGFALVGGCARFTGGAAKMEAACPGCGKVMAEDAYCQPCNAVATSLGEFKCETCGKVVKAGTYCEKHNRFRFPASVGNCLKCGKEKGMWCEKCGHYALLPQVTYDAQAGKPMAKKE